jgi:teichuronic acid exporter
MDLAQKIRSAYAWTFAGNLARQAVSFALSMLMARFLAPGDYGLAATVSIFVTILSAMQDAGIGQAVIYFEEEDLPTVCTISAVSGTVFGAMLFLAARPIASLYHSSQLAAVTEWMSLSLVLGGIRAVSQALVTKRLLFNKIAIVESVSSLLAAGVAVYMAWKGYGVWSIVANALLASGMTTILMLIAAPPRFTLRPNFQLARRLIQWSLPLTGSSLLWAFYDNSDDLVVGRMSNPQQLGFYTLAFRLATLINERINAVISRVSFPALAAMREDFEQVIQHWLSVTRISALFCFPALTILALCARDFVVAILGPKWLPSVEILRILCIAAAIRILTPVVVNLLPALGKSKAAFSYSLLNSIVMPLSFVLGCTWGGIRGVAIAWVVVFPFLAARLIHTAMKLTGLGWTTYLGNLRTPVCCAATVAALIAPILMWQSPGILRLIFCCIAGSVGFGAWLYVVFMMRKAKTAPAIAEEPCVSSV